MKRYYLQLLFLALFVFSFQFSTAQSEQAGRWEGTLEVSGMKLEMSIELEEKEGNWSGTLDIPVQNVKSMVLEDLKVDKNAIFFKLPKVPGNASYEGKFVEKYKKIEGEFQQSGTSLPLEMVKRDISVDPAKLEQFSSLVDSLMQELQVVGMGVGILKGGKVVFAEGFGYRNDEGKAKADANTIFAIGSSSKAFTTMGLGMLSAEGKLDWNEPIQTYMPDFKMMDDFATREMTATDLVTHQSGLPRHDLLWYGSDLSRQDLYKRLRYLEPNKSFRSTFQYQNLMYMTAGILIEKLSGESWEDYTQKNIFKPLGMNRSNLSVEKTQKQDNYSFAYQVKEEKISKMAFRNIDVIGPAGSINSSVNDMLKWVQLHLDLGKFEGTELVESSEVEKMHSPHKTIISSGKGDANFGPTSYGLGWFILNYGDTYIVQHGGNIDGFSALVVLLPKEDIGMVFLSNQNGSRLPGLSARYAIDILLDKEGVDWYKPNEEEDEEEEKEEEEKAKRVADTQFQHKLSQYAGTYEDNGYGKLVVTEKDGKLHATYNSFNMAMEHWHFETFQGKEIVDEFELLFTFHTDNSGEVVSVSALLEASTDKIIFNKLAPDLLSDATFLEKLTGIYQLDGTTATIALKGETLTATIPGQSPYTLVPKNGTTFDLKGLNGFSVEFVMDKEKQQAEEIVFYQPNGTFRAKRKEKE